MENKDNKIPEDEKLQGEKNGNITVHKNKTLDFVAKIGCVLIAFVVWFYAAGNDTTIYDETFTSVTVKIINNGKFSVLSGDDTQIDITLSGKRSVINKLSVSDFSAFVDISEIEFAGGHKLDVQYDLPNGVTLSKSTASSITVYVDNTTSVTVPVKIKISNYMLEDGYELGVNAAYTDITSVTVTGPEAILKDIQYARFSADLGHLQIKRTMTVSGELALIGSSGSEVTNSYVKMNAATATATIPVYKYLDLPINVTYKYGYFNDGNCRIESTPSTVRIKGEADLVDSTSINFEIDEKQITGDTSYTVSIDFPEGITNVDSVETASISVKQISTSSKRLSVYNITVTNPDNLSYEPIVAPINIMVRGDSTLVSRIGSMNVTAVVDLSLQSDSGGTVLIPVTLVFSEPYTGRVYELGTYSVSVKINGNS